MAQQYDARGDDWQTKLVDAIGIAQDGDTIFVGSLSAVELGESVLDLSRNPNRSLNFRIEPLVDGLNESSRDT